MLELLEVSLDDTAEEEAKSISGSIEDDGRSLDTVIAVSYTHLTLPTILLV